MKPLNSLFKISSHPICISSALLLMRLVIGIAFFIHGSGKIQAPFNWMGPQSTIPGVLQFLAALSEFGGGIAWTLGLVTPLASFGLACTMGYAVYFHRILMGDPFVSPTGGGAYELALVYFSFSVLMFFAGPGKFSLDFFIFGEKK